MVREISEPALPRPQHALIRLVLVGALAFLALPLAGCGRQGALDPPPGGYQLEQLPDRATAVTRNGARRPTEKQPEYDDQGRPIAPKGLKKKLPGDWLID
jgi:hypothetical protein